jgi:hypothetical protein
LCLKNSADLNFGIFYSFLSKCCKISNIFIIIKSCITYRMFLGLPHLSIFGGCSGGVKRGGVRRDKNSWYVSRVADFRFKMEPKRMKLKQKREQKLGLMNNYNNKLSNWVGTSWVLYLCINFNIYYLLLYFCGWR